MDAWVPVSLVGIDLINVEARVVVPSIDTNLNDSAAISDDGDDDDDDDGGRIPQVRRAILERPMVLVADCLRCERTRRKSQ